MKVRFLCILLLLSKQIHATLIDSVRIMTSGTVGKYEKFEVGVASLTLIPSPTINVYNPSHVNMYAIFTAPNGKKYRRMNYTHWARHTPTCLRT